MTPHEKLAIIAQAVLELEAAMNLLRPERVAQLRSIVATADGSVEADDILSHKLRDADPRADTSCGQ